MASATFLRGSSLRTAPFTSAPVKSATSGRSVLVVEANKRVQKKAKVVLVKEIANLGKEGEIKTVPVGYWRNYLQPRGFAKVASADILELIRKKKEDEIRAKLEEKAKAQAFANALSTIGKFSIKKKVGDKEQIYGSVSVAEVVDAVYQQTGQKLNESDVTIPDIKVTGTYECSVKLHPEVVGTFNVVITKDKVSPPGQPKKK